LDRGCRLIVFLVLILIPCLYPFLLPERVTDALERIKNPWLYWIYSNQLYAFLNYGYSPLPLKEGAFSILVVALFALWLIRQAVVAQVSRAPSGGAFDWKFYGPIAALLAWSAISLLYSPTFYYSLTTYALVVVGALWLIIVYEMPKTPRLVRRWFNTILLAGAIVAFFAFLQDVDRRRVITGWFFVNIAEAAARNDPTLLRLRMGSLIGHNIGVASFLTFSWFILLSRLFQPAPLKRKILWGAVMLLLFYVFVATQTRGIWIVLMLLTPFHFVWLMRLTGKRWDLKPLLGAILIVLIILTLQIIPSPRNPFYSPESPLLLRFTHFSPSHLRTETRLRIAVCSGSLVAARPLRGHGLGSFQYVYPKAQGDYFAEHPDSVLAPSPRRTMRAHSDWLQLVIELGFPGLIIVLLGLYLALRRGWESWLRLGEGAFRLEMTAALMGVAGVMIHGLADFPIHVVSTAAPALFLLAVWTGCGRIGARADATAPVGEAAGRPDGETPPRPNRSAIVLIALVVAPLAIGASAWFYSLLHASMYHSLGISYRIYYGDHFRELSDEERRRVIGAAYAMFRRAHKTAPLDCEIVFRLGEAATLRGVLATLEAEKARAEKGKEGRLLELARSKEAYSDLQRAIYWLNECQREVRYHEVFHYLGMAHEHLYRLSGSDEERQRAKEYYRLAVRYSPCFSRSLYRLFLLLQKDRPPNPDEMREVCRKIARYDPILFWRQFTKPVMDAIERREFDEALVKIDVLLDVEPENTDLWLKKVHLLAYTGRGAEAAALLETFRRAFPKFKPDLLVGYRMEIAVARRDYEKALSLAEKALATPGLEGVAPYFRVVRAAMLEKLGRPEAAAEWKRIETLAESDIRYLITASDVFLFLLRDPDRAYPFLVRCCRSKQKAPASIFRIAARLAYERGEKDMAVEFLENALKLDPADPAARRLLDTIKI